MKKHGFSKSKPHMDNIWPRNLFLNMTKTKRIGNCILLKSLVESGGGIGICGNRATSPLNFSVHWHIPDDHFDDQTQTFALCMMMTD